LSVPSVARPSSVPSVATPRCLKQRSVMRRAASSRESTRRDRRTSSRPACVPCALPSYRAPRGMPGRKCRQSCNEGQAGSSDALRSALADAQTHARMGTHSGFVCESEEVSDAPSVVCFSADWFVPSDDRFGIGPKGIKTPLPPSHGPGVVPGGIRITFAIAGSLDRLRVVILRAARRVPLLVVSLRRGRRFGRCLGRLGRLRSSRW
jgi:hypothetical protein